MNKKWKIFIVTTDKIIDKFYENDNKFNNKNYCFFNVSHNRLENKKYSILNACDIVNYKFLGKQYAESEVIYNIKKLNLTDDLDYVGILHYDYNFYNKKYDTLKITENINNILDKFNWISFFTMPFKQILGYYNVLLDERKPNCLFVRDSGLKNPITANDYSCKLINKLFGIDVSIYTFNENYPINMCCSFLVSKDIFDKMSHLIISMIDSKYLNIFDIENRHRIQGQVAERLIAMMSLLYQKFDFTLDHRFIGGRELNNNDINGENY